MSDIPLRPKGPGQPGRADAEHESRCRRCGVSCHLALPINDVPVVIPGLRCQFLSLQGAGWGCTVYDDRFQRAPWCHHADVAGPHGMLADDCPYTVGLPRVSGKVQLSHADMERVWPAILAEVMRVGVPHWVNQEAFLRVVTRREGGAWRLVGGSDPQRLTLRRVCRAPSEPNPRDRVL